jgi:hypothetical protein
LAPGAQRIYQKLRRHFEVMAELQEVFIQERDSSSQIITVKDKKPVPVSIHATDSWPGRAMLP